MNRKIDDTAFTRDSSFELIVIRELVTRLSSSRFQEVVGSSSREMSELGVAMSGPMPSTGDWALYFRGAKQLEHFLAALSVEVGEKTVKVYRYIFTNIFRFQVHNYF